jgi:tetratricopeptide (TPR) repeat protein
MQTREFTEKPVNLTRLTIVTSILMVTAAALVLLSPNGPFGSDSPDEGVIGQTLAAGTALDLQISDLQARSAENPGDTGALTQLGFAYLQKSRETGDPALYSKADGVFQQARTIAPGDPTIVTGLGAVALARHDFGVALVLAQEAIALDPNDADSHAVAGDALTELGRYEEAEAAFQRVADLRPDLSALVRVAYTRELHGDIPGAAAALEEAIEAGGPRGENAAYARVQLGNLLVGAGSLQDARARYESALDAFPGYVHALAGLARVHAAWGEFDEAIDLYAEVTARQPVLEYIIALGDAYAAAGDDASAARQYALAEAIDQLYRANGVNTDLETAVFLADRGDRLGDAVAQATSIYLSQPGSVRAADALAWALHRSGNSAEALEYARQSLRLGTRDNNILFHAAMIERAAGDPERARDLLQQVINANPGFSLVHGREAAEALAELTSVAEVR